MRRALQLLAVLVGVGAVLATGASAARPFEGFYRLDGVGPRFLVTFTGARYELQAADAATLRNGCKVKVGDARFALRPRSGDLYDWSEFVYTAKPGSSSCPRTEGKAAPARAVLSPRGTLQVYCTYAPKTICFSFVRVTGPALMAKPQSLPAGSTVTVVGAGFGKLATVTVTARGPAAVELGKARADGSGMFEAALKVPAALPVGSYSVVASVPGGKLTASAPLSVGAGTSGTEHPFEGLYRLDGVGPAFRVVFTGGRYEGRAAQVTSVSNGCKVYTGDVRFTLTPVSGDQYDWSELVYTAGAGSGGERGDGCTRAPGTPARTRAVLSPAGTLQIYCSYAPGTICFSYVRSGQD